MSPSFNLNTGFSTSASLCEAFGRNDEFVMIQRKAGLSAMLRDDKHKALYRSLKLSSLVGGAEYHVGHDLSQPPRPMPLPACPCSPWRCDYANRTGTDHTCNRCRKYAGSS